MYVCIHVHVCVQMVVFLTANAKIGILPWKF